MLSSQSFRSLAARIKNAAQTICNGKLVMTHEGGYSLHSVPFHCLAVLEELSGIETEVVDPYLRPDHEEPNSPLPHQVDAIARAEEALDNHIY